MSITIADMLNLAQNAGSSGSFGARAEQMQMSKNGKLYVSKKRGFLKSIYARVVIRAGRIFGRDYETKFCLRNKQRARDAANYFRDKIEDHLGEYQTKGEIVQFESLQKQRITPVEIIKTWKEVVKAHQPIVGKVNNETLSLHRLVSKAAGQNWQNDPARVRFSKININLERLGEEHRCDLIELYNDYATRKFDNKIELILKDNFNEDFADFIPVLQKAAADHSYARSLLNLKEQSVGIHGKLVESVGDGDLSAICDAYVNLSYLNFEIVSLLREATADKSVASDDDSWDIEINTEAFYKPQPGLGDSDKVGLNIPRKRSVAPKKRLKPSHEQTQAQHAKHTPMTRQRIAEGVKDISKNIKFSKGELLQPYYDTIVEHSTNDAVSLTSARRVKSTTLEFDFLHAVSDNAFLSLASGSEATEDRTRNFKQNIFLGLDPSGGLPLVLSVARDISQGKDQFKIFGDKLFGVDSMSTDFALSVAPSLISGTISSVINSFSPIDNESHRTHDLLQFCQDENYSLKSVRSLSHKRYACEKIKSSLIEKF